MIHEEESNKSAIARHVCPAGIDYPPSGSGSWPACWSHLSKEQHQGSSSELCHTAAMSDRTDACESQYWSSSAAFDDFEEVFEIHLGSYHLDCSKLCGELLSGDVSVQAAEIRLGLYCEWEVHCRRR